MINLTEFPNNTCPLKLSWNTLFLWEQVSASCHRTGRIPLDFDNLHNEDIRLAERKIMYEGSWPEKNCNYCKKIEENGRISDRQNQIKKYKDSLNSLSPEIISNKNFKMTPTLLEVYFSNVCNMSCIYCGPQLSSKWVQENKKFGEHEEKYDILDRQYPEILSKFWKWFERNYKYLAQLHILGGEPLFQKESYDMIDFIESRPNKNLDFGFFTNLKVPEKQFEKIIDRLDGLRKNKNIKRAKLICSLDAMGDSQEYVRAGLDLNQWIKNFEYVLYNYPDIALSVSITINALSMKQTANLFKYLNEKQKIRKVAYGFQLIRSPDVMKLENFPTNFFDNDFEEIIKNLPDNRDKEQNAKTLKGMQTYVNSCNFDSNKIIQLQSYLDKMDARHNTNWKDTFPWLKNIDIIF